MFDCNTVASTYNITEITMILISQTPKNCSLRAHKNRSIIIIIIPRSHLELSYTYKLHRIISAQGNVYSPSIPAIGGGTYPLSTTVYAMIL